MKTGNRTRFEFRRTGSGNWQRRNVYRGGWLTLHVERIQQTKLQTRPNGRDPSTTYSPAYNRWTWL